MSYRILAVTAVSCGLALGAAACSSGSPAASSPPATHSAATHSAAAGQAVSASAPFGPACAAVPSAGAGSFSGMAAAPVATAASDNPVLSTLVAAVKKAGLVNALNSAQGITVFAPDNAAFARIPKATLAKVLANKKELTKILTYHVAAGRHTPAQLATGTPIKTMEGATVTPARMGGSYEVNTSRVVCGNVQTANATVYIIDKVMMPPA